MGVSAAYHGCRISFWLRFNEVHLRFNRFAILKSPHYFVRTFLFIQLRMRKYGLLGDKCVLYAVSALNQNLEVIRVIATFGT